MKDDIGAQIILGNTYHLYLKPGIDVIEKAGGSIITYDGKRAGDLSYDFNKKYQIIAASTKELAYEIKEKLRL